MPMKNKAVTTNIQVCPLDKLLGGAKAGLVSGRMSSARGADLRAGGASGAEDCVKGAERVW